MSAIQSDVEAVAGADDDVVLDLEVFDERIHDALWHRGFDLQQRGGGVTELAKRPIERLEQVVGAVVRHVHVGVANHPEQVRADELHTGKELAEFARTTSSRNAKVAPATPGGDGPPAIGMKRREQRSDLDASELVAASLADDDREVLAAVRDHGERVAGSNARGVSSGKDFGAKIDAR